MNRTSRSLWLATSLLLLPGCLAAAVVGRVVNPGGDPITGATVGLVDGAATATTDHLGYFTLADAEAPARVWVHHPRFRALEAEVPSSTRDAAAALTLIPKHEVFDEIHVTSSKEGNAGFEPVSVAITSIQPDDKPVIPATLVALVEGVPGVAENGQGGQFQSYSIRGVAGHVRLMR